jgi:hypothetical protein
MNIFQLISNLKFVAGVIGLTALISCLLLIIASFIRGQSRLATQLLGSLLVVALSLYADNLATYIISVFVIATWVTELSFLEKLAALIWNRKEYWSFLMKTASKEEAKTKTEADIKAEIEKNRTEGPDEIETVEETDEEPEGISEIESPKPELSSTELVQNALRFEDDILNSLEEGQIPFQYGVFLKKVTITSGAKKYIIDCIIETKNVHYLIEIKYIQHPSSLRRATEQVNFYKVAYENYLKERNIKATVQPLIIVPSTVNISEHYRGIPISKFDINSKTISDLKQSYSDFILTASKNNEQENLRPSLLNFLRRYSKWAFSPLRIQRWGSGQPGYEMLKLFTTKEIKQELEHLKGQGLLVEKTSKIGNRLYKAKA